MLVVNRFIGRINGELLQERRSRIGIQGFGAAMQPWREPRIFNLFRRRKSDTVYLMGVNTSCKPLKVVIKIQAQ